MSIYATIWQNDDEPLEYQGSHVLPESWHAECGPPRGIDVAEIPDHIEREGLPHGSDGQRKPWLRLMVWAGDDEHLTMVLTGGDVRGLHTALGEWLARHEAAVHPGSRFVAPGETDGPQVGMDGRLIDEAGDRHG